MAGFRDTQDQMESVVAQKADLDQQKVTNCSCDQMLSLQYLSDIMTTSGHGQKNSHRPMIVTGR